MDREKEAVSYKDFIHELQKQFRYLSDGGTDYRLETAKHSLDVANKVKKVSPFLDLNSSRKIVFCYVPDVDQFRVNDIAKMLYTSAKKLHLDATLSDEARAYVEQKMKNMKPLTFM